MTASLTILSGDVDNKDSQMPIITDLNTVWAASGTTALMSSPAGNQHETLDGFTVTAGYEYFSGPTYVWRRRDV